MKLKNLFWGALASLAVFAACEEPEQNLGTPDIGLSVTEMTFDTAGGEQTLTVTATRDWMVETDADWVVVSPESGSASAEAQTVTVSVLENTGLDREVDLKFTIGMKSKYLTVSQAGPGGSAEALVVYSNNFDKTKAEKGSNGWATYLDSFDGWLNATGSGVETVTYGFDRMTARTNSGNGSAGSYSDYVSLGASGQNYLWFGSGTPYFAVKNITLPEGKRDFTLSFGTERYLYEATDNTFNWDEFKAYVSADGKKWVKLACDFAGGALPNGRWDLALSTFTVPAGTSSLYVYFVSSLGSAYALDDLKLVQADKAGKTLDFANGEEFEVGGNTPGGNTGGDGTVPESKGKKTVEEFIAAADNANYYELTGKVSGFNPTYCSFDLTDDSGKIYVYSVLDASKAEWSGKISNGGTITIYGKYLYYEQKSQHEVVDAHIVSFKADGGSTGGNENPGKPESLVKATIAEFLAAAEDDTWYELTGEIISIAKEEYGNFTIKDATGEVYIYGMTNGWVGSNDKSFSQIGLKVGDTVTLGSRRGSYNGSPQGGGNPVPAYYISHVPGEGGGETPTPPAGEAGEYEPQGVTWTLGEKAYDNTSGTNAQVGTVNGEQVNNMLKLGTSSLTGDATLHVAAGTKKLGFYCVAWKNKTAQVKFSVGGSEIATIEPKANPGATGNPPYASINVTASDYYEVELPSGTTDIKVETLDSANGRVIFIGLKAITE
ncbi:MAG: BACON domain-containing protein [Bacteroidales bacterium]|nr:BACON domain-containing protein [Bacteroidales bacterium]